MLGPVIKQILILLGEFFSLFSVAFRLLYTVRLYVYTGYVSKKANITDRMHFSIEPTASIGGKRNVYIHSGHSRKFSRVSAIEKYQGSTFTPKIVIGKNVNIGINTHIGAVNMISIGDNFLTGANCLITDHSHGKFCEEEILTPPQQP